MRIFLHCRWVESMKAGSGRGQREETESSLPFFGDVFVGSAGTALGATIFTAALADCGLAKKAMVACGV